ncbi:MAG TPA: radical SAM protein [Acidobacteriota bacterium]|nr:radical SAM protein [Acidobacteriota bacterium]
MQRSGVEDFASPSAPAGGKLIVLTAPLTEIIDHAGFFIQMGMASMPVWMEGVLNRKYPLWRELDRNEDGSAQSMPAGIRVLEASLLRRFSSEDVIACYPDDISRFIGPNTRAVAVSTHNPLGVTFAAGVYASVFGTSKHPINSHYTRQLFLNLKKNPWRNNFKVIVGGSGAWQITKTRCHEELGIDCVVEGRSESVQTLELFSDAIEAKDLPQNLRVPHPKDAENILIPSKRTTFGVVEMTTGCGRRCRFCLPDLSPQMDLPKERILAAVRANVQNGNRQISLATEDLFIWGQVHTKTPFYFPNRDALLNLFEETIHTPGVEQHLLSHSTMAPAVVDPVLIRGLSELLLPKSPIHLPTFSTHPQKKILSPLIGLETGSVPLAKKIMPGKAAPFPIEEWPSVFIQGLTIMNRNNWFPVVTLIIGSPEETDEDTRATLDLVYEVERRKLFAFFIPSIFTPLHDTKMSDQEGVGETQQLTPLQWQLMMKCWKMNVRAAQFKWWAPAVWRLGALGLWLVRLRKLNGPNFTWPLLLFSGVIPEKLMARLGKITVGKPFEVKSRKELLATIPPQLWKYLRPDTGDTPVCDSTSGNADTSPASCLDG